MAAQKSKQIEINLLPQEEFATTTVGKILHWLLSTFRYLVITTEMIVIVAFLSRFYFDSRVADLNDEIDQKREFIEAYADFEKDFRLTQQKLGIYSNIIAENNLLSPVVDSLIATLPSEVSLSNLHIETKNTILLEGASSSEQAVSQFLANLKAQERFSEVSLSKLQSQANSTTIIFSIQVALKS